MARARAAILAHGGARARNVFTRIALALFGEVPWRGGAGDAGRDHAAAELVSVPSRQGLVLVAHRHGAAVRADGAAADGAQPARRDASPSCSSTPPETVRDWISPPTASPVDRALPAARPAAAPGRAAVPGGPRRRAIDRAVAFVTERLNGEDGLGAIFPAMANALMMFDCLGYPPDHPALRDGRAQRCASCSSSTRAQLLPALPVAGVGHRAGLPGADGGGRRRGSTPRSAGARMAAAKQVLDVGRRLGGERPELRPGGWAFQYDNPHYPDLDDTAAVALALDRFDPSTLPRRRSTAPPNGSSACRAATAAGAPSTSTTRITT